MIEQDPATLRALAAELDKVADQAGANIEDDFEQYLAGYCGVLAATYRTRAIRTEQGWQANTAELPIVKPRAA